jgi:hypothetical protein
MTDPSLAAQAVLDALIDGRAEAAVGPQKRITWWNDRVGLAAALRAVVLKCEYSDDYGTSFINPDDILAIATDLEA